MAVHTQQEPRTVTVRVRTLVIWLVAIVLVSAVVEGLRWASSMTPFSGGGIATAVSGMRPVAGTDNPLSTGPPLYRWAKGGRWTYTLQVSNTGHVPITVTGTPHSPIHWGGLTSQPTLELVNQNMSRYSAFHPVSIPAGGERLIAFVFRANPAACRDPETAQGETLQQVTLNFTALSVFHDAQHFPVDPSDALNIQGPSKAACIAGGLTPAS